MMLNHMELWMILGIPEHPTTARLFRSDMTELLSSTAATHLPCHQASEDSISCLLFTIAYYRDSKDIKKSRPKNSTLLNEGNNVYCIFWNIQTSFAASRTVLNFNWQWCFCFWHSGYQPLWPSQIGSTKPTAGNHIDSFYFQRVFIKIDCCILLHLSIEFRAPNRLALSSHIWPLRPLAAWACKSAWGNHEHNWHEWRRLQSWFPDSLGCQLNMAVKCINDGVFLVFRAWMVVERTWDYIQCRTLSAVSKDHNDHVTGNTWSSTYGLIWFHLKSRSLCIHLVCTNCVYLTYFASCSMEIY